MRPNRSLGAACDAAQLPLSVQPALLMLFSGLALLVFAAGCTGPSGRSAVAMQGPATAAYNQDALAGTWRGSFGQVGASIYTDDGECLLQIRDDRTFTAQVTPQPGANNLAKVSTWSGTVVQRGDRVTLHSAQGPSLTLVRTRNQLYGVAEDPLVEATIAISLEREGVAS
jgi:hypothetical protein